jgi:acetoin utilization deacetylase AcuC-like enzyme
MSRTAVVFSPIYYRHNPGKNHPESAQRLHAIIHELNHGQLANSRNWQFITPEKASIDEVELAHGIEYIRLVEAVCKSGGGMLDLEDTRVSRESYEVALQAVGGTLKAVKLVMAGEFQNAFALVRPPGHHAGKYHACGFCLFNNIVVAAKYLITRSGLNRILILDVDAHHGNGTQEAFYDTDKVLFISLHEDPSSFPGTGFIDEIGEGRGLGYNVNIPLSYGTGDHTYSEAMNEIVKPIMLQYEPQFILISAGFDGLYKDPIANLKLTRISYRRIFEIAADVASEKCKGRLVSVLEGGYNVNSIGRAAATAIATLSGATYAFGDEARTTKENALNQGERILREVKRVQSAFWRID